MGTGSERTLGLSKRPLRVLRVIGRLNMGGPAHQAALLSGRRFDGPNYETLLVHGSVAPDEASLAELSAEEGATMQFVSELQQAVHPLRDPQALLKLIRIARSFEPDVVHTHTAKAGFIGRQAALAIRPRPAIVHTYHGHVLEGYFGTAKSRLYFELERALARISDCLIGVSQATIDDLVRLGVAPATKFKVVPLGLDLAQYAEPANNLRHALRLELGIGDDDVLLVFVGRIVPIKRLDVLVDAVAYARGAGLRLHLGIVGDGDLRPQLEARVASLGITQAVHFFGYRGELRSIFAAADVAVLSSDNEGTPVSLIEAAAAGLPSVATDVGGVREVVAADKTGLLVPPDDAQAFANALGRMTGDAELRIRFGLDAQHRALASFDASRLLHDIDALYAQLTAPPRR